MTVKELIQKLQGYPLEEEIFLETYDEDEFEIREIVVVRNRITLRIEGSSFI